MPFNKILCQKYDETFSFFCEWRWQFESALINVFFTKLISAFSTASIKESMS